MIPDVVQKEHGRVLSLTWVKQDNTLELIEGSAITGIIESVPGPSYTIRLITGALDATYNPFTWELHYDDSYIAGEFTVQFKAILLDGTELRSIPERLKVIRSPQWP